MKPDIRWQVLLAVIAFCLVLSLLSFQAQTAGLCTTRVPAAGGALVEGIVGAPQYLNPLLSDPYPVDRELISLIFDGLTIYNEKGELAPALAQSWSVSEDGLSFRFVLRDGITWHDGEPVTAADVAFTYGLLQDEAFPGAPALKALWQSITISQVDGKTIDFILPEPYGPFLEATTRGILPAHRLQGVTAATLATDPFNSAPIGTGPFMVAPNQDWQRSHTLRLSPNPVDWRQGSKLSNIEFRFFPDQAALIAAFAAGEIQALNHVSPVALPQVAALPHTRLFTASAPRYTALLFNLTDSGSPALRAVEGRRALAHALNRDGLIDRVLNGQGLPLEGPYLPTSWAYNPNLLTMFNYDPATAAVLLDSTGWSVPEGGTIRQREGTPLSVRLLTMDDPTHAALAEAIAAQWANVGVETQVAMTSGLDELRQALASRAFDVALVDIAPPGDPDLYDFWSQEAIIRGQNYAGWNNRRASEALESGRQRWTVADRQPSYDNFLRFYDGDLPALTLFQHVYTYGLSEVVQQVSGSSGGVQLAEIGLIAHPRDRYKTFADWFLFYRDVTVGCPVETPGSAGF